MGIEDERINLDRYVTLKDIGGCFYYKLVSRVVK